MRLGTVLVITAVSAALLAGMAGLGHAAPRHPPAGSYESTCINPSFSNAGILTAQCKDAKGQTVAARLRTPDCGKGDIANTNGALTCPPLFIARIKPLRSSKKPAPPPMAHGPLGPASLILFDDIDFKGRTIEVAGDIPNLELTHFNDLASSVRVVGGQWLLCVDAEFKGHCTLVDKDSPNLSRFSLNNRISSIRRVG